MLNTKLNAQQRFHPTAVAPHKRDNPVDRYYTIITLSAGAVWGNRHFPLIRCTSALYFILE